MVDIVRCDRPSGQAGAMPRPTCMEEGCTREAIKRGRCEPCYARWHGSPDFVLIQPHRSSYVPRPPAPDPECPWCGPYTPNPGTAAVICPTCGLDAIEHAYIARILADSDAVYAEEHRAFQSQRQRGGP